MNKLPDVDIAMATRLMIVTMARVIVSVIMISMQSKPENNIYDDPSNRGTKHHWGIDNLRSVDSLNRL
jgi:hypothetical protein